MPVEVEGCHKPPELKREVDGRQEATPLPEKEGRRSATPRPEERGAARQDATAPADAAEPVGPLEVWRGLEANFGAATQVFTDTRARWGGGVQFLQLS